MSVILVIEFQFIKTFHHTALLIKMGGGQIEATLRSHAVIISQLDIYLAAFNIVKNIYNKNIKNKNNNTIII